MPFEKVHYTFINRTTVATKLSCSETSRNKDQKLRCRLPWRGSFAVALLRDTLEMLEKLEGFVEMVGQRGLTANCKMRW